MNQGYPVGESNWSAVPEEIPSDPLVLFEKWLAEAAESEPNDPNAMAIATAGADGLPNVRMVLLKSFAADGFVFYTNLESRKGTELLANMYVAGTFHWKSRRRQFRFRGPAQPVPDAEADAYFASRARDSRVGAWASQQSRPVQSRQALREAVDREAARFDSGEVPRPPYWTGIRVAPVYLEFWTEQPYRLHDRLAWEREKPEDERSVRRLYP